MFSLPYWMDPSIYEYSYHNIELYDDDIGLYGTADITKYVSGWQSDKNTEYWALMSVVAGKLGVSGGGAVSVDFEIGGQSFHKAAIRRAYEGRAAPEEIRDATRLAFMMGRFRLPVTGPSYANTWFGIDCNTFVGNYCGISPSTSIAAYAHGYPSGTMPGATQDVYTSRGLLPLPPVDFDSIKTGTLLLTFGDPDKNKNRWRHIALVQSFAPSGDGGLLSLAEWGGAGGSERHIVPPSMVRISTFKCAELPGKTCVAYPDSGGHYGADAKRIFFDGSKFDSFTVRGMHVYNGNGAQTFDT